MRWQIKRGKTECCLDLIIAVVPANQVCERYLLAFRPVFQSGGVGLAVTELPVSVVGLGLRDPQLGRNGAEL